MSYIIESYKNKSLKPIYTADDFAMLVHDNIEFYADKAMQATKRAQKTREEVAAEIHNEFEEENARLKEKLQFSFGFLSSEKEVESWHNFIKEHETCRLKSKVDGGKMPYIVPYGTGIGQIVHAHCPVCGVIHNITDTSVW